jgi:hypothetical protein
MKLLEVSGSCVEHGTALQPHDALLRAMKSMESMLSSSSLEHQVEVLFAALKRAVHKDDKAQRTEVESLMRMWQPCLRAAAQVMKGIEEECSTGDSMMLFQRCTAGTANAPKIMQAIAADCELAMGTGCMPLYLVSNSDHAVHLCHTTLKRTVPDQLHI